MKKQLTYAFILFFAVEYACFADIKSTPSWVISFKKKISCSEAKKIANKYDFITKCEGSSSSVRFYNFFYIGAGSGKDAATKLKAEKIIQAISTSLDLNPNK